MAKKITLRNNTATNTGKGSKMTHAEMDANLETFYMSSSLDGTTLYLHSTGSANVDSIDLSGLGGAGAQGIQGIQGLTGAGTQGIQGLAGTGIQGTDGAQGIQGIAGGAASQGIQGTQGLTGIQGTDGAQGIQGPASAGSQGIQGIQGPAAVGSQGTAIAPFAFAKIDASNYSTETHHTEITSSAHTYTSGVESYIDFTFAHAQANTDYTVVSDWEIAGDANLSQEITNKTTAGFRVNYFEDTTGNEASSATVSINQPVIMVYASTPLVQTGVGAQGANGFQGTQGANGAQGIQGLEGTGIQGIQGIAGGASAQGVQGIQGSQGIQGIQGLKGSQGIQGIQGLKGSQGIQGIQGLKGSQGIQGTQGLIGVQGLTGIQGTSGDQGDPGIAEADFYNYPTLASGGAQGVNVTGKVVAGSTVITTGNSEVLVQIGEIANLVLGQQVHVTATGYGASSIPYNVTVQDPQGASALPFTLSQSGDIVFKTNQNIDGTVFIMYHIWYTTDTFPG